MKEKILKIGITIVLIATLVMTNFIWVGYGIVIAMYEELEAQNITTNVKNVDFDAYFLNDGSKTHSKQGNISEEQTLILNINVKEKGSLNDAKIKIENSNFVILKDKVNSEYVKNIDLEKNEIELNQIIYQNNAEISLPISFNKEQEFKEDCFDKENTFSLSGTYKEEEKETNVEGNIKTRMIWTEQTDVNLSQGIEKFINLGEQGILLEQNITTEVIDNKLPRENETLEVEVPELEQKLPENVTVLYNGDKLAEDKVEYQKENKKLIVKNETKGIWGNAKNEYKVIYQYPEEIGIENKEITLKTSMATKLYTKEEIVKEDTKNVEISETGNIASISKTTTESLEKGYMYAAGEIATTYFETNKIELSNAKALEKVEVENQEESFLNEAGETFDISNKTNYLETTLNKENIQEILGENGIVTIYDGGQNTLAIINNQTEADENGNITIAYEKPQNRIKIVTSKPENEGTLIITNKKQIEGNTGYTKEQLKTFTSIATKTKVATNLSEEIAEARINLVDTKTEATISINNNNLSTLQKNENVQLLVTLKSNSAKYDLFKNPKIEIVLPKELNINVKNINQMNGQNELIIVNPKLYQNENGDKVISMDLQGEQKTFANDINEGIQIAITADIEIDKTTPSKETQITMNYTNENREGENFTTSTLLNLNSKSGVLVVNQLENYNENNEKIESIDDETKIANIEAGVQAKEPTGKISIVNNYSEPIKQISIIGKLSTESKESKEKSTFEAKLKQAINIEGKNAKIYYSEDENAQETNNWKENVEDFSKVKVFKIELQEDIGQLEVFEISYVLTIPEMLKNQDSAFLEFEVTYQYAGTQTTANSSIALKTNAQNEIENSENGEENRIIEKGEKLSFEIVEKSENRVLTEDENVKEGQIIEYTVKVQNTSNEDLQNIHIKAVHENAILWEHVVYEYEDSWDETKKTATRHEEVPDKEALEFDIETLKVGETKEIKYQISIKEVEGDTQKLTGNLSITGSETKEITYKERNIVQGDLKLTIREGYYEQTEIHPNGKIPIGLFAKNCSENTLTDIIVEVPVPEQLYYVENEIEEDTEDWEFIENNDGVLKFKISSIEPGQTAMFEIQLRAKEMELDVLEENLEIFFRTNYNNVDYYSNIIPRTIYQSETQITVVQTSDFEEEYIKDKDAITFTTTIENKGLLSKEIDIYDDVPEGLVIKDAYLLVNGNKENVEFSEEYNTIAITKTINPGETIQLLISTEVNESYIFTNEVTNYVEIIGDKFELKSNEITYKIGNGTDIPEEPQEPEEYSISGYAWIDRDKNGTKEQSEESLENIEVLLIDETTGQIVENADGEQMKATTNETGMYQFTEVKNGSYLVVFKYDNGKYRVTEYKKPGATEEINSDVISKEISLEGQQQIVALTGSLKVEDSNLEFVNAGFIQNEKFDLRLDKYINKIIIQNNKGTTVREYNNTQFTKIEIDAKQLANSTVIIEYLIRITNEGELAGYVNEIVDNMPKDLNFSSEMNNNWYQGIGGQLHTKELSNKIINPGKTEEITLTLVKSMNENNTGTTINVAEINETNNDFLISDIDSIPGNNVSEEDDISKAELIISIRTGSVGGYITLIIVIIAIIGIGTYFIKKRVLDNNEEN